MTKPNTTKPTVTLASSVALPAVTAETQEIATKAKLKGRITGNAMAMDPEAAFAQGVKEGKKRANDILNAGVPDKDAPAATYLRWIEEQRIALGL